MQAQNRSITDWYGMIKRGEIKLPRFQRYEAWDRNRISSLLETITHNLPLGITLVLKVAGDEKFISRYMVTAPETNGPVYEQLLDGQQRLTSLWRTFHNNYDLETYFVYFAKFDKSSEGTNENTISVQCRGRYYRKNGHRYPLWCDEPSKCLERGCIPVDLLKPEDMQGKINEWIFDATKELKPKEDIVELEKFLEYKKEISDAIRDLRSVISNYNLPFLTLPPQTSKDIALNVFINMNTNSKPLSTYDIIVAEVESVSGQSLHDMQENVDDEFPIISKYWTLSDLILTTSALIQDQLPSQRGVWNMDKKEMMSNWELMKFGLRDMANFLREEGIYDYERLPTNAVLAVIAALCCYIPESGDKKGSDELLLKKYLWHAFFTDRYENSAPTNAYADYIALKKIILGRTKHNGELYTVNDVPIFRDHDLVEEEELLTAEWPKRATIRGRAILAVACRLGAMDFFTGERINATNIKDRHYHHVYPDGLLKEAEINGSLALNCSLVKDKTNMSIGRKDPLEYMRDRYQWTTEEIVSERLQSHLIPEKELANGGYEGIDDLEKSKKLKEDFEIFLIRRAEIIIKAVKYLADGRQLSRYEIFKE